MARRVKARQAWNLTPRGEFVKAVALVVAGAATFWGVCVLCDLIARWRLGR